MEIFLASMKQMTGHFVVWCLILILLCIASYKTKRMDKAWIVFWETKHNASIETYKRSISKIMAMIRILKWLTGIITLFAILVLTGAKNSDLAQWVRIEAIKATMILVFFFIILVLAEKLQKKRMNRIDELQMAQGNSSHG